MKNSIAVCIIGDGRGLIRLVRQIENLGARIIPIKEVKLPEFNLAVMPIKLNRDVVDFSHKPVNKQKFPTSLASLNQSARVKYRQLLHAQYKRVLRVCR